MQLTSFLRFSFVRFFHSNGKDLSIIGSNLINHTEEYRQNNEEMVHVTRSLHSILEKIKMGGNDHSRALHVSRGKLLPRERISHLLDPGTNFLELSPLAGNKIITLFDDIKL